MLRYCRLGPTRNKVEQRDVKLPIEYKTANRRGCPKISSEKDPKDDKVIKAPINMHAPKPIIRSLYDKSGQRVDK